MGRDNFLLKLRGINSNDEHIMVHSIVRIEDVAEMAAGKDNQGKNHAGCPQHRAVYCMGLDQPVRVVEKIQDIIARCEAYSSVLKEIK